MLLQLEALKAKLQQEGLFDSNRKRSIPKYPSNIGIVTSYPSAACEDLIKNINRRYPLVNIYVFPSLVQGITAPNELIKTLSVAYTYPLDVLIIARGGGSIEDLWAFNDENLIRKLATSPIPTISAIGHEIDFTLCDFVCDVRASTPTGAAEIATPNKEDILYRIDDITINLKNNLKNKLYSIKERFIKLKNHTFFTNQLSNIKSIENDLTLYKMRLLNSYKSFYTKQKQIIETKKILLNNDFKTYIKNIRNSLEINYSKLNSLSPKNVLKRGYSYLEDENGKIISSINDVKENQIVKTTLKDGMITLEVIKKGE